MSNFTDNFQFGEREQQKAENHYVKEQAPLNVITLEPRYTDNTNGMITLNQC